MSKIGWCPLFKTVIYKWQSGHQTYITALRCTNVSSLSVGKPTNVAVACFDEHEQKLVSDVKFLTVNNVSQNIRRN